MGLAMELRPRPLGKWCQDWSWGDLRSRRSFNRVTFETHGKGDRIKQVGFHKQMEDAPSRFYPLIEDP